ncbi:AAA family ATPase [Ruegeria sp.]|uniref:AAA family ATPase n=1 Tax=Ruegeria sp. TaxID=1879320 RepID=UPI003B010045
MVNRGHISQEQIGEIEIAGLDETTLIFLPPPNEIQYKLQFSSSPRLSGFKIGSHRATPKYQAILDIPVGGIGPKEAFKFFRESSASYEQGQVTHRGNTQISNPISPLKQTLISFALHGSSNDDVSAVPEIKGLFREFQYILRKVLPKEIAFHKLNVRSPEIIVETGTGDFPIDGASGGLMSLIQVSWQIFLYSWNTDGKCVVLIDEPENHLHPSLQREFLARLVQAFQDVQFIVATHSPFIICSVKDSYIYALRYQPFGENGMADDDKAVVISERIDLNKSVGTASKVLDEVLGVSVTIPIWAEEELAVIVGKFEKEQSDEVAIKNLRDDLASAGLSEFLPQAISRLLS